MLAGLKANSLEREMKWGRGGAHKNRSRKKEIFFIFNGLIIMREREGSCCIIINYLLLYRLFFIYGFLWQVEAIEIYGRGTAFVRSCLSLCATINPVWEREIKTRCHITFQIIVCVFNLLFSIYKKIYWKWTNSDGSRHSRVATWHFWLLKLSIRHI